MKSYVSALTLSLALTALTANATLAADQGAAAAQSPPASPIVAAPAAPRSPAAPPAPVVAEYPAPESAALQGQRDAARQRREAARQRRLEAARQRLDAARQRLEVAAQQVAQLSAQMSVQMSRQISGQVSREVTAELRALAGPPRALIGLQLAASSDSKGARVLAASPGGPAEQAGVRAGDLIVAVDGHSVQGRDPARQVLERLRKIRPGQRVRLRIVTGGAEHDVTVIARAGLPDIDLARRFADRFRQLPLPGGFPAWGGAVILRGPIADMELARVTPGLGRYFGTEAGVLVVRAPPRGALGLKDGDVILAIGARKVFDSSHVVRILASYDPGEKIRMQVMREHRRIEVSTTMPVRGFASRRIFQPSVMMRTHGETL